VPRLLHRQWHPAPGSRRLLAVALLTALVAALAGPAPPARAQISFVADLGANEADVAATSSLSITTTNAAPAAARLDRGADRWVTYCARWEVV
jgi:hypothetical protein